LVKLLKIAFVFVFIIQNIFADCGEWFVNQKLKSGNSECLLQCQIADVNMGTFDCPQKCESLCKKIQEEYSGPINMITIRLCEAEKYLIKKAPSQAYDIYSARKNAFDKTEEVFTENNEDDQSDAFRHCFWSGSLIKSLGKKTAKQWLNAHESCSKNLKASEMDYFNNAQGIKIALNLIKNKSYTDTKLADECLSLLKNNTLKVLKPLDYKGIIN